MDNNFQYNIYRKSQLDSRELFLLDSQIKVYGKSMGLAYVLWYILGIFGGHRFYLGRKASGLAQLILTFTIIGVLITLIWWFIDAFQVHKWVKEYNLDMENRIMDQIMIERGVPQSYYP